MLNLVVIRARNMDRLVGFYEALGLQFTRHRHGKGPEHLSAKTGEVVFEIYPSTGEDDGTTSTRLGFSVPSLMKTLAQLKALGATMIAEPSETPFGVRAVVMDLEGHKVELYNNAG